MLTNKEIQDPTISVVTVTYNAVDTLEDTILSIINQNYCNIEYIIIDGGSTDGTLDIIRKYEGKLSYWVSELDKGIYDAMNKALKVASGDWLIFLGGDDLFFSKETLQIVKDFKKGNIYYGDVIFKNTEKRYIGPIKSIYDLCLNNICHQSLFYPKDIYKNYQYDTSYTLWADYVMNLTLFSNYKSKFHYLDTIICIFNDMGRGSLSSDKLFIKNRLSLIYNLFGFKYFILMKIRYQLSDLKKWIYR